MPSPTSKKSESKLRGAAISHISFGKRFCSKCGFVFQASRNGNSNLCPKCSKEHDQEHRSSSRKDKLRNQIVFDETKEQFGGEMSIVFDPSGTIRSRSRFRVIDVYEDFKNKNYYPNTIIKNNETGKYIEVTKELEPSQCSVLLLRNLKARKPGSISNPIRLGTKKNLVIIYRSSYTRVSVTL